jgi:hypothetical protein
VVELLFVSSDLGHLKIFNPSLENITHILNPVFFCFVCENLFCVLFELAVRFESSEALHLEDSHASDGLAFTAPERHDLTPEAIFLSQFGLLSQALLELLYLLLLGSEERLAPTSLGINGLLLLMSKTTLGLDELRHGLAAEPKDELVQPLREGLVVEGLRHLVIGREHYFGDHLGHLNLLNDLAGGLRWRLVPTAHPVVVRIHPEIWK